MKNWNDSGTVNFDAETAQFYTTVKIDFIACGRLRHFELLIPMKIRKLLKQEHFDQAVELGKRIVAQAITRLCLSGCVHAPSVNRTANFVAHVGIMEHLYNEFTLAQAALGNNVWATPRTMQAVGPDPINDFKN